MSISDSLGRSREVELEGGRTIRYRECGDGESVVFAHGLLMNGDLWRNVVPAIAAAGYRCISPDLPLGSHERAMPPSADLSTPALAALLGDFIDAVGARGGTLVANDTGGALSQVLVTTRPEIVGRLALTSCDAFDIYPPYPFNLFRLVAGYVPGAPAVLSQLARLRPLQRSPAAFGWVAKRPIEPAIVQSYTRPARESAAVRRDVVKILRGIGPRYTEAAAEKLPDFRKPAVVIWAAEDRLFPTAYGRRLAELLSAEYVEIPDSHTFIAEDQPQALAKALLRFLGGGQSTADVTPTHWGDRARSARGR